MELDLAEPYVARPYRGPSDHALMAAILRAYRLYSGIPELPTAEQMDVAYANLTNCDPATDIAIVETGQGDAIGYVRASFIERDGGGRECATFAPTLPSHLTDELFVGLVQSQERHMRPWADGRPRSRFRADVVHPGPDQPPTGEAACLESMDYTPINFSASLVRPDLDAIAERQLPAGVEVRPVTDDMLRTIWEAHQEAFRGEWDHHEATENDFQAFVDEPLNDTSLWKIAWAGDVVVGQVKSFVNDDENLEMGYLRGYTEEISTHAEWRNRGIAGALLAMSLHELRDRGMTEAALGADTQNPGGAFHLYTSLGFELQAYGATYVKPIA